MIQAKIFDSEIPLPDAGLTAKQKTLLGFDARYARIHNQMRLLLNLSQLEAWDKKHHGGKLAICGLVAEQHPFIIFQGDVGTGKTANAECIANRLAMEAAAEDAMLFKLSNRVRGTGKVGEMGSLVVEAFQKVVQSAGKTRRSILIIDEGDSLATSRVQDHSHHEDKVAVNTLIQCIDNLRLLGGRVAAFLCTNRFSILDPALKRRAAIIEEFRRPNAHERRELFSMDLSALSLTEQQIADLVKTTDAHAGLPSWTYSDIRNRLYPAALAAAFPDRALTFEDLKTKIKALGPSPVLEDR